MADQGRWFKLWYAAVEDPDLDNLDIADFGRWAKLGAFIKAHGTSGTLKISPPARALCSLLQVADFRALTESIKKLPNVHIENIPSTVTGVTFANVTYANWFRYQGDFSGDRVRKYRDRVTPKEEKRGEEKRRKKELGFSKEKPVQTESGSHENNGLKKEATEIILRVWIYYLEKLGKNPRLYTFTAARKAKGMARLREAYMKTQPHDLEKAEKLLRLAVDGLAESEFHSGSNDMGKRYDSWERHLFPSQEKLEWWIERAN